MIASTGNVLDCLSKIESGQPSPPKALRSENGEAKVVNGHAEFFKIEAERDSGGELFESQCEPLRRELDTISGSFRQGVIELRKMVAEERGATMLAVPLDLVFEINLEAGRESWRLPIAIRALQNLVAAADREAERSARRTSGG